MCDRQHTEIGSSKGVGRALAAPIFVWMMFQIRLDMKDKIRLIAYRFGVSLCLDMWARRV